MTQTAKILIVVAAVAIAIGLGYWWLMSQNNNQNSETLMPVVATPEGRTVNLPQSPEQNEQTAPGQPAEGPNAGTTNPAPSTSLTTGSTNDDISKDLTNVDSQMNSLDTDVTNSNPSAAPAAGQ